MQKKKYTAQDIDDLCLPTSKQLETYDIEIEWVVEGIIPKHANTMIYSEGGVGKSLLMLQMATAVANGEEIFGLKVEKMPVTYIDFENPLSIVVDRVRKIGGSTNLKVWHLDNIPPPYRLDTDKWEIYRVFDPGLFIIDSLRSSHRLDENSSQDISLLMERLKFIRGGDSTIVLIHNESKTGDFRGSSSLADLCDQVLMYGCVEEVGSEREISVANTASTIRRLGIGGKHRFDTPIIKFPLYLTLNDNGKLEKAELEEKLYQCMELFQEGIPQAEIAKIFGVRQQTISKWLQKIKKLQEKCRL
jgi:archaellum biogenesis ATPase FlaH